jgi:hypothetical protein
VQQCQLLNFVCQENCSLVSCGNESFGPVTHDVGKETLLFGSSPTKMFR